MKLTRTDGLPVPDGVVFITFYGVDLEVGFEVLDANESVGTDYAPLWAKIGDTDVSLLISEIPNGWEQIADEIHESTEGVFL